MSSSSSKLAVVYVASGLEEANIVKAHLEEEEIPTILQYESAGVVFGLTVDGLGAVKVLVPIEYEREAKEMINAAHDEAEGPS